jgi:hypothetical protein
VAELRFFSPYADIHFTANRLPHWQQQGAVYFITFGLADAVPHHLRTQWESEREAWLRVHPQPWSGEVELEYQERSQTQLNAGSMLAMARAFCGGTTVPESWQKRCGTSMVKDSSWFPL